MHSDFCLVFTAPAKWRIELRAKIGQYRNRCLLLYWLNLLIEIDTQILATTHQIALLIKLSLFLFFRKVPFWIKVMNIEIIILGLVAGIASTYSAIKAIASPGSFTVPCYVNITAASKWIDEQNVILTMSIKDWILPCILASCNRTKLKINWNMPCDGTVVPTEWKFTYQLRS